MNEGTAKQASKKEGKGAKNKKFQLSRQRTRKEKRGRSSDK